MALGIYHSKGINTMKGYAIGDGFSTATLVTTIVATWIGGEFFFGIIYESYNKGLNFIWPSVLSDILWPLIVGLLFAPRMGEFLGKVSIAEAMGDLFGKHVRLVTAIAGCIGVIGIISMQLKVAGVLFENAFNIPNIYGVIFSGIIITFYSFWGGIKSVTFTDIVQFFTFGVVIPALVYFLFYSFENTELIITTLTKNQLFDYKKVFDLSSSSTYYTFFLFLYFIIPSFNPAIFQRIAMAKNIKQVQHSFVIAAIICFLLSCCISWIAVLILSVHPNLSEGDIFKTILSDSGWIIGFKGLILSGIMAMVMSTIDSYINSSAILLIHDVRTVLGLGVIRNELFTTRICALVIGCLAVFFSMSTNSFVQLFMWANMFYMPVVSVPFIFAIFGFRSSSKSVLIGMAAGFSTAIIWEVFIKVASIDGVIPGMFGNVIALLGSHYILGQPGGWVGIKNHSQFLTAKHKRKQLLKKFKKNIVSFNLLECLIKKTPKSDGFIALTGLFIVISNFSTISALTNLTQAKYSHVLNIFYPLTLCLTTGLMSYPLWLDSWKRTNFIPIFWNIVIFFVLICFNFFTVLISNFAEVQLMVFLINILIVSYLLSWRLTISFLVLGVIVTLVFLNFLSPSYELQEGVKTFGFRIIYLLFLIISTLIIFLRPKQEQQEANEAEVTHLGHKVLNLSSKVTGLNEDALYFNERIAYQEEEIERLGATAQKILNNVNHELRLPVGNVINFAEMLNDGLGKFDEKQLKILSEEVYKNSNRLSSMIMNMLDLATLNAKKLELDKKTINLGELVIDRVNNCRKIYLEEKKIDFVLEIQPNMMAVVDPNYMRQVIDNLVINSIKFSSEGVINIKLLQKKNYIEFTISDNGIGIPEKDLYDIFTPFKMGSNTESKAEGRGVGLALCKTAIEAHGGVIKAKSKGGKGAQFRFVL